VWGAIGFVVAMFSVMATWGATSVGVGTSAYVTMGIELWIGGMVFFGVGSLLAESNLVQRPEAPTSDKIPGVASYEMMKDGSVHAVMEDGREFTFSSWENFWRAVHQKEAPPND
jgi:hypothetical protein